MRVTRIITKTVNRCMDCPYFNDHPHEPTCDLKREMGAKGYDDMCSRWEIDPKCPIKNGKYLISEGTAPKYRRYK